MSLCTMRVVPRFDVSVTGMVIGLIGEKIVDLGPPLRRHVFFYLVVGGVGFVFRCYSPVRVVVVVGFIGVIS